MPRRIKLVVALGALGASLVVLPTLATGSKVKTRALDGTIKLALIESPSGKPAVFAGIERDKGAAPSSVISRVTVTGTRAKGTTVNYFKDGTLTSKNAHTIVLQPDGSLKFTEGKFTFTGGTGRYKRATGGGTYTGTLPKGGTVITLKDHFKIHY